MNPIPNKQLYQNSLLYSLLYMYVFYSGMCGWLCAQAWYHGRAKVRPSSHANGNGPCEDAPSNCQVCVCAFEWQRTSVNFTLRIQPLKQARQRHPERFASIYAQVLHYDFKILHINTYIGKFLNCTDFSVIIWPVYIYVFRMAHVECRF